MYNELRKEKKTNKLTSKGEAVCLHTPFTKPSKNYGNANPL